MRKEAYIAVMLKLRFNFSKFLSMVANRSATASLERAFLINNVQTLRIGHFSTRSDDNKQIPEDKTGVSQSEVIVNNDEDLQGPWKLMESRVTRRKVKRIEEMDETEKHKIGRSDRRKSPWDAEEI